jgi:hypothetical protein
MLVENKFLFVSLPRCASTSFYISCLRNGFDVKHYEQEWIDSNKDLINLDLDNEKLADEIIHSHERIIDLNRKFGDTYDIISIKRDRHKRFISVWKHIIDMIDMGYPKELMGIFKQIKPKDVLFFKDLDLITSSSKNLVVKEFAKINKIEQYIDDYMTNMLLILFKPMSYWHSNNQKIKWFEFGNFEELEKWVSNKTGKHFRMEKSNGSQHFECELKLNDEFIKRYDSIYDYYDIQKNNKTLI